MNVLPAIAVTAVLFVTGCSLEAPPPASSTPEGTTGVNGSDTIEQTVGLAPVSVSEAGPVSPDSPVNFAALNPVPMAFVWYGRTDLDDVPVTVAKAGTASRFEFTLRDLKIKCEGLIRFDGSEGFGEWELFCDDASQAAGILVPVAGERAINGQGIDGSNRSVIFSIPLRN